MELLMWLSLGAMGIAVLWILCRVLIIVIGPPDDIPPPRA